MNLPVGVDLGSLHDWHFPRQRTIERITFYLDGANVRRRSAL
jgi:hypothetical protein